MKLWSSLYLTIWIVFLQIWLAYTPIAPPVPYDLHLALGVAIVAVAYVNARRLRATTVPGRIKRIANATFGLTLLMAVLGGWLFLGWGGGTSIVAGVTVLGVGRFLHFVNAMAILSQASATAVAYDMWEEHEFLVATRPGEVPPAAPGSTGAT